MSRPVGPLYAKIEADLRREIAEGKLALGSRLPTEHELSERYGVARMTVRQALERLASAGILNRRQGVGTFVARVKTERVASRLLGFREDALAHGLEPSTQVLDRHRSHLSAEDAALLGVEPGESALNVRRLRFAAGEPLGHNLVLLLEPFATQLYDIDWTASFYEGAAEALGYEVTSVDQKVEAVAADPNMAAMLDLNPGEPLLTVTRVTYLANGRRLGLTLTHYRGDRYYLTLKLNREGPGQ